MTKIIDEIGRDVNLDRKGIEFLWLITHSYIHNPDKPEFVKPDVKPYQCEEITLIVKGHFDIIKAKVDHNTYVYLGHWNDGVI